MVFLRNRFLTYDNKGDGMTNKTIIAENLTYVYGELTAVNHISFSIEEGEILGFLGPNGAGKTTTVKMLTGQLKPGEGTATLLGLDVSRYTEKIQANIGVCFETTNLYEKMSAVENLVLFARLFNVKNFDPMVVLERVGLAERGKDRVETYSKGMKQRLMIARSILHKPRVLFLDEPTAGLDPTSSEAILNIISEERDRGATIFLTTHDMVEADKLSNRVAFLNQGNIVALDTPLNLKQKYGKRALKVTVTGRGGNLEEREIILDTKTTADEVRDLFSRETIVTAHSEEATLEDIFIKITGRGLVQ
jgi:ABC-2 type transport system ATP-binding protein